MKILDSNFSIYLNNTANYTNNMNVWQNSFSNVYNLLQVGKKIPTYFKEYAKEYSDRFPANFKIIKNINRFNQQYIQDLTYNNPDDLLNVIDSETLLIKKTLDKVDKRLEDLIFNRDLDIAYFSDIKKLYDTNEFLFGNSSRYVNIYNKYYNIVGDPGSEYISNADFIQSFLNLFFLTNLLPQVNNFKIRYLNYLTAFDSVTSDLISKDFNKYIDDNITDLTETLTYDIITHNYSTVYPAKKVKKIISDTIVDNIYKLKEVFLNYLTTNHRKYNTELGIHVYNIINNMLAINFLDDVFEDDTVLTDQYHSDIKDKEKKMFDYYLNKVDPYTIKNHMLLCYTYKFWPSQLINILPFAIHDYTSRYIYHDVNDDHIYKINKPTLTSFIYKYVNNDLDLSNYALFLNNKITDIEYILKLIDDEQCIKFAISTFFIELFDDFIESEHYNDFSIQLLRNIFINMKNDGLVDFKFNWYDKNIYVKLFFRLFLRKGLIEKKLFQTVQTVLQDGLINVYDPNHIGIRIVNDKLSGSINGTNLYFITTHRFRTEGFSIRLVMHDDSVVDVPSSAYKIDPENQLVWFNDAPDCKEILASYRTNYFMDIYQLISRDDQTDITNERVEGDIDGVNRVFYTKYPFIEDSIKVYIVNPYERYQVDKSDYTVDGPARKIMFKLNVYGSYVLADYSVLTNNELSSNKININFLFKSLLTNSINIDYMYDFIDSFYYSSLVKQITFDILSSFYIE